MNEPSSVTLKMFGHPLTRGVAFASAPSGHGWQWIAFGPSKSRGIQLGRPAERQWPIEVWVLTPDEFISHVLTLRAWIAATIYKRVRRADIVDDLCQLVYLRATTADPQTLSTLRNPKPYILTIIASVCAEHWRNPRNRDTFTTGGLAEMDDLASTQMLAAPGPTEEIERRETVCLLDKAIDQMPPKLRAVYHLCERGLSLAEIAVTLAIPISTAKKRKKAAIDHIARQLKSGGIR